MNMTQLLWKVDLWLSTDHTAPDPVGMDIIPLIDHGERHVAPERSHPTPKSARCRHRISKAHRHSRTYMKHKINK